MTTLSDHLVATQRNRPTSDTREQLPYRKVKQNKKKSTDNNANTHTKKTIHSAGLFHVVDTSDQSQWYGETLNTNVHASAAFLYGKNGIFYVVFACCLFFLNRVFVRSCGLKWLWGHNSNSKHTVSDWNPVVQYFNSFRHINLWSRLFCHNAYLSHLNDRTKKKTTFFLDSRDEIWPHHMVKKSFFFVSHFEQTASSPSKGYLNFFKSSPISFESKRKFSVMQGSWISPPEKKFIHFKLIKNSLKLR